jgi:hypothetical protein
MRNAGAGGISLLLTVFFNERPFPTLLISLVTIGILAGCASPRPLTGGDKDVTPPRIVAEESTPNKQVNFSGNEVTITFDEWIQLKDIYSQLIVSPLMPKDPDINLKGRSIIIELPDSLMDNTTYSINFGNAIIDLNEGNILENYSFVFSTGPVLDSISLQGQVMDAVTLTSADGVWVMLHEHGVDSAVYKIKPAYVAKTNKAGNWTINNIRNDTFDVVALKDANLNFLYDQETELLGWVDTPVVTNQSRILPSIMVFPKSQRALVSEVKHDRPGLLTIVIKGPQPKPMPELVPPLPTSESAWDGDTLRIWYPVSTVYEGVAILGTDTTAIRAAREATGAGMMKLTLLTSRIHPAEALRFKADLPLMSIDTSLIQLAEDSLGALDFTLMRDSISTQLFSMKAAWKSLLRYRLVFLPGALTDYWGRQNDTIRHTFVVIPDDQFGIFKLTVTGLDSLKQYVLNIKSGDQVLYNYVITGVSMTTINSAPTLPGKYMIELVEDINRDGKWNTGNYDLRIPPERKKFYTPDNLRAGWDLEAEVKWDK